MSVNLENIHGIVSLRECYRERRLEVEFPELRSYLKTGFRVLDVGCGPGSITADVARAVAPGHVTGVDVAPESIAEATASAGEQALTNIDFVAADAYALPFGDDVFDLVYSHVVVDWLRHPVRAIQEQARVAKPGGWIVMRVQEYGTAVFYPRFEALERFVSSWCVFGDPEDPHFFWNTSVGRQSLEIFSNAGLEDIRVYAIAPHCSHASRHNLDRPGLPIARFFENLDSAPPVREKLISSGALSETEIIQARADFEAWKAHPHALFMFAGVLATGRSKK